MIFVRKTQNFEVKWFGRPDVGVDSIHMWTTEYIASGGRTHAQQDHTPCIKDILYEMRYTREIVKKYIPSIHWGVRECVLQFNSTFLCLLCQVFSMLAQQKRNDDETKNHHRKVSYFFIVRKIFVCHSGKALLMSASQLAIPRNAFFKHFWLECKDKIRSARCNAYHNDSSGR